MSVEIILDIGSSHQGQLVHAIEMIEYAKDAGADIVKFQYLHGGKDDSKGNISFKEEWFPLVDSYKDFLMFSCWTTKDAELIYNNGYRRIKIAHHNFLNMDLIDYCSGVFRTIYVTLDSMQSKRYFINTNKIKTLWTYAINGETVYPVDCIIDFDEKFDRFDGFSDHTMGYKQTLNAIKCGAKIIEKHICFHKNQYVPDARFALPVDDCKVKEFIEECRKVS